MSIQQHKTQCKACKFNRTNYDVNCLNLSSQNVNRVKRATQNTTWNMLIQRHKTQSEVCVSICVSTYENFRQNIQELKCIKKEIWNSLKIFVVFCDDEAMCFSLCFMLLIHVSPFLQFWRRLTKTTTSLDTLHQCGRLVKCNILRNSALAEWAWPLLC